MTAKRQLSLFDVLCLGVNAIVGSGIYAFPGILAAKLGPASILAFGLCGLISMLVGLCFAEASGMFDRSGGPYIYAQAAMGGWVGFLVGWSCWIAAVMSWAAVARAIPPYLGDLWPPLGHGLAGVLITAGITLALGGINMLGVKPGAYTTDLLTIAKLLPLVVLVAAGLSEGRTYEGAFAPHGYGALPAATFTAFFAFQGFEVVPVPAGETSRPRRNAPIAVIGALLGATLLYMAIQWVAVTTTSSITGASQPLAEMGRNLLGSSGGMMVAIAAVISMLGFCAGVAFTGPRYLEPLADDANLPVFLARRHERFGTPYWAIIVTTGLTVVLVVLLSFGQLVNLSVLTVSFQYLVTSIAVIVLRGRHPDRDRAFRLPAGPVIPLLASAVITWQVVHASIIGELGFAEVLGFVGLLAVGGVLKTATDRLRG